MIALKLNLLAMLLAWTVDRNAWTILFAALLAVPDRPEPPVVVSVTYHSVELKWDAPSHDPEAGKLRYCLQEEGESSKGFANVYKLVKCCPFYPIVLCVPVLSCSNSVIMVMSVCCAGSGFALRYIVTGLDSHSMYNYRLRASNDVGGSAWSPVVKATTTGTLKECMHACCINSQTGITVSTFLSFHHNI